jgi:hypothetical protein
MSNPKGNEASLKKFKPKWQSGETRTIRVPIILVDQILIYARKLDLFSPEMDAEDDRALIAILMRDSVLTLSQVIQLLDGIADTKRFTQQQKDRLRYEGVRELEILRRALNNLSEDLQSSGVQSKLNH